MLTDPMVRMEQGLRISTWLWWLGVVVTAVIVGLLVSGRIDGQDRIHVEQLLFSAWTLGPPCWFLLQYRLWPPTAAGAERFRLHQGLLKVVWAGITAFISAIMFGRWG